jgi:hypothetical protein
MTEALKWRQNETTNKTTDTKSSRAIGVQKLRPSSRCSVIETKQERTEEKARSRTLRSRSRSGNGSPLTASLTRTPLCGLRGEFLPGESPSGDPRAYQREAVSVVHFLPVVVAERLFIKITEQVKRFHAHVGTVQSALQRAPEVLHCVGVNSSPERILRRDQSQSVDSRPQAPRRI